MPPYPPAIGDRIGPYVLEERIGQGGFGEVWRARHSVLEEKVVAAKIPTEDGYIGVLRREGIIQHRLKHPLIVEMLDIDIDHDPPYLVMEYVEGGDLRKLITREAPLPAEKALRMAEAILEALQVAHEAGAIHRDLKPENVLLPREGGIKLTDFGLGTAIDASRPMLLRSQTMRSEEIGTVAGTLAYMAPEQRSGKGPVDGRADIFAFGVILFELITGELPVGPVAPTQARDDLWPEYDEVYRKCCAPIPYRYESVPQVLRALRSLPRPAPEPMESSPPPIEDLGSLPTARPEPLKMAPPPPEEKLEPIAVEAGTDDSVDKGKLPVPTRASRLSAVGFLLFAVAIVVASVGFSKLGDGTGTGTRTLLIGLVLGALGLKFLVGLALERDEAPPAAEDEARPPGEI